MTDAAPVPSFPIVRNETARLSSNVWGVGQSVWGQDGVTPRVDQLSVARSSAPGRIAQILGGRDAWLRARRYLIDERPVIFAESWVPADLAEGTRITELDTGPGGVFARLAEAGHGPARFSEDVGAIRAAGRVAELLAVEEGEPLLTVLRTAFDAEERAVEVSEMVMLASVFRLRFDFPA